MWKVSAAAGCVLPLLLCTLQATAKAGPTQNAMSDARFLLPNDRPVDGFVDCFGGAARDVHPYQVGLSAVVRAFKLLRQEAQLLLECPTVLPQS